MERRPGALLLTGGASRRMGRDKAALVIGGNRLADRTAALLGAVAAPVVEVGPGFTSLPRCREDPPRSGPLAALVAGADALRQLGYHGSVLVLATDLPRLTQAFLQLLVDWPAPGAEFSVVPQDSQGRAQPLCARYSPAALACAVELVAAGRRSMGALLEAVPVAWVDGAARSDTPADVLCDVDTPDDLAAFNPATNSAERR